MKAANKGVGGGLGCNTYPSVLGTLYIFQNAEGHAFSQFTESYILCNVRHNPFPSMQRDKFSFGRLAQSVPRRHTFVVCALNAMLNANFI